MVNETKCQKELDHLRAEHLALEGKITSAVAQKVVNQFEVQRLKKQKLELRDQISKLEDVLVGNIVA